VPFTSLPFSRLPAPLAHTVQRLLRIDELENLYHQARSRPGFFSGLLEELDVQPRISSADLRRVPPSGPVIALSNHPFGILDGALLTELLSRVRADVRVLTNRVLGQLPELAPLCIFLDPFDRQFAAVDFC
jgi:putative hemolysin